MFLWTVVVLLGYVWILHGEWNGIEYDEIERWNKYSISLFGYERMECHGMECAGME